MTLVEHVFFHTQIFSFKTPFIPKVKCYTYGLISFHFVFSQPLWNVVSEKTCTLVLIFQPIASNFPQNSLQVFVKVTCYSIMGQRSNLRSPRLLQFTLSWLWKATKILSGLNERGELHMEIDLTPCNFCDTSQLWQLLPPILSADDLNCEMYVAVSKESWHQQPWYIDQLYLEYFRPHMVRITWYLLSMRRFRLWIWCTV